jgi:hypothetical protein
MSLQVGAVSVAAAVPTSPTLSSINSNPMRTVPPSTVRFTLTTRQRSHTPSAALYLWYPGRPRSIRKSEWGRAFPL